MAVRFNTFDFNDTGYDNSKDQIIVENAQAVRSFNVFKKNIVGAIAQCGATEAVLSKDRYVIRGEDYRDRYLKAMNKDVTKPADSWDEEVDADLYTVYTQLQSEGKVSMVQNGVYLQENDNVFPNMIPSLPLKQYLQLLQKSIGAPLSVWTKPESGNLDDVRWDEQDIYPLLSDLQSFVTNEVSHCNIIGRISVVTKQEIYVDPYEINPDTYTRTVQASLDLSKVLVSVTTKSGKLFRMSGMAVGDDGYTNEEGMYITSVPVFGINELWGSDTYGNIKYQDGIANLGRDWEGPEYFKMKVTVSEVVDGLTTDQGNTYIYKVPDYASAYSGDLAGYIGVSGTPTKISESGYGEDTKKVLHLFLQMLGRYSTVVPQIDTETTDELVIRYDTDDGDIVKQTKLLNVSVSGTAVQNMVDQYVASIKYEYEDLQAVVEDQKTTPLGKILADSNYLVGLVNITSLDKLSQLYISYYIPLAAKVNSLRDEDKPIDNKEWQFLVQHVGNRLWDYVDVVVAPRGTKIKVLAVVPNWNKLRKAPARLGGAILAQMMRVEQQPKKPKRNWGAMILQVVIAVIVTVSTGGTAGPWAIAALTAMWVATVAAVISAINGSKGWAKLSTIAGYVGMVIGMVQGLQNLTATAKGAINSMVVRATLTLAGIGMEYKHKNTMKDLEREMKQIETEHRDIITMDDAYEINKKVERFIYTDSYDFKYSYDQMYTENLPKRC